MILRDAITRIITTGDDLHQFVKGSETAFVEVEGGRIPTLANLVRNAAKNMTEGMMATSTSVVQLSAGQRTFIIQPGKSFQPNQLVTAVAGEQAIAGNVVSYVADTLVVNITHVRGGGTASNWNIYLSGVPGLPGRDGADGTGTGGPSGPQEKLITKLPWEM